MKRLNKKYSFINPDPTLQSNLLCFGYECGDGWLPLLEELFDKLQNLVDNVEGHKALEVIQVKEKWGSLCVYLNYYTNESETLIDKYVEKSKYICEWCGEKGKLRNDSGWFTTLCDDCHTKRMKNMEPNVAENGKTIDQTCDNCYRIYQIPENSTVSRCPFCSTKK